MGPLPSKGCPSIVVSALFGTCLPSSCLGMRHSINIVFSYPVHISTLFFCQLQVVYTLKRQSPEFS
jgi:hypothetical protein